MQNLSKYYRRIRVNSKRSFKLKRLQQNTSVFNYHLLSPRWSNNSEHQLLHNVYRKSLPELQLVLIFMAIVNPLGHRNEIVIRILTTPVVKSKIKFPPRGRKISSLAALLPSRCSNSLAVLSTVVEG